MQLQKSRPKREDEELRGFREVTAPKGNQVTSIEYYAISWRLNNSKSFDLVYHSAVRILPWPLSRFESANLSVELSNQHTPRGQSKQMCKYLVSVGLDIIVLRSS